MTAAATAAVTVAGLETAAGTAVAATTATVTATVTAGTTAIGTGTVARGTHATGRLGTGVAAEGTATATGTEAGIVMAQGAEDTAGTLDGERLRRMMLRGVMLGVVKLCVLLLLAYKPGKVRWGLILKCCTLNTKTSKMRRGEDCALAELGWPCHDYGRRKLRQSEHPVDDSGMWNGGHVAGQVPWRLLEGTIHNFLINFLDADVYMVLTVYRCLFYLNLELRAVFMHGSEVRMLALHKS